MSRSVEGTGIRVTRRQAEILALIATGLSDKEVAQRLGLTHGTIRTHLKRLFRRYKLHSRMEAVEAWIGTREPEPANK